MASRPAPPPLAQHLCFKLYSTSLKITQLYKPMLAELNLTYPQYLVMVVLWEEEGLGIKQVASRLGQDSGSITPIVKRLEAEGYLVRNRDPLDERNRVLTLTEAGQLLRAKGVHINQCIIKALGLSQVNAERMMLDLNTLSKNLAE
jgi:DNA-binding MarR family transcriptional regulator